MKRQIIVAVMLMLALMVGPLSAHARYLNPNTGRFQTMDSYEGNTPDPLSLHKYLYVHGNPVNRIDPSGLLATGGSAETVSVSGIMGLMARQVLPVVIRLSGHIAARGTTLSTKSRQGQAKPSVTTTPISDQ